MKLKAIYDNKEDIPEGLESAYVERNGKFELQVEGMKTSADVERIQTALDNEREDHKKAKRRLKGLGDDEDGDTVQDLKDKVEDLELKLETAGKDSVSEDDVQKRVDAGVRTAMRPVERENTKLKEESEEKDLKIEKQAGQIRSSLIKSDVASAINTKELGINPDALPDIEIYAERVMSVDDRGNRVTRDGVGVPPGLTLPELIADMRANNQRNHWFGKTQGSGSGGSDGGDTSGANPFKEGETWNSTEQGHLIQSNPNLAKSLAEKAGGRGLKLYTAAVGAA